ncbi:MAG: hypothetical protein Q8L08_08890 [Candidatus Nanopelagicaceae bacterium]|nr:hypothetical protein [Candidatus Nanopelagicaceae bacterium]
MAGVLSGSPTLAWLVPWGILFGGLMTIVIVAGVSYFVLKDPSRLMLTEVSGSEYRAIQQDAYLGDSKMGLRRIGHESTESLAIEPLKIVEESIVVKLGGQDD